MMQEIKSASSSAWSSNALVTLSFQDDVTLYKGIVNITTPIFKLFKTTYADCRLCAFILMVLSPFCPIFFGEITERRVIFK